MKISTENNISKEPYLIMSGDGSPTLYDPAYGQSMHTMDGAYSESIIKHVRPSGVLNMNRDIRVLDIGFGLGYNLLALICEAEKTDFAGRIEFISLEFDRSFEAFMRQINFADSRSNTYALVLSALQRGQASNENVSINVRFGDARAVLKAMPEERFDAVFHDPFSPAKNPEMWSVELFSRIASLMQSDAVLTTYSSALQIRAAMRDAGFFIGSAPSMGMKREGTIAAKSNERITAFTLKELELMMNDKKAAPYRDPSLSDSRETIIERRRAEMKERKRSILLD